ncbi:hypothetical protein JX265_013530 [Neoarthrinium moseri]|uniref:RBR-type E3 ubiquitin transferase n=1 Tax=Neoarthrinium moseri TaxID=1658444 RepID=A0A9P9W8I7_9PEZI|nr:uncharacterized protein JN550_013299 [Neoarthrinium moseri]KAI1840044.1 hypothetical protein JX266_013757 [Neoarthrinium moseri]KAI1849883.1 hypothetical protein JX265_013530 [Neoarthrinium moseri]KAI1857319.1 hypothetical protein JN550_013299 [Neoarthrinium moseri]
MAPHLTKKRQPDEQRRPTIWRFISSRRFAQRGRRDSADNADEVQPRGIDSPFFQDSDRSESILINDDDDDDDADARSACSESQYSDAHSTWEHPITNREDAISLAFSELLHADARDSLSNHVVPSASQPGVSGNARNANTGTTADGTRDDNDVVSVEGLSHHLDTYLAQNPDMKSITRIERMDGIDPFSTSYLASQQSNLERPRETAGGSSWTHGKGKSVDKGSEWSSARNPWAVLESNEAWHDERHELLEENARLREQIEEMKATMSPPSRHNGPYHTEMPTPEQSPSARPASRLRRSRQKKRQDVTLFETTTLRDLVLKRLFTPHVIVDGIIHDQEQPVTLDTPLTPAQVHDFTRIMNDIITSGSHLKQPIALCAVCHLPKFKGVKGSLQSSYVSEVLAQLPTVSSSAFEDFDPIWGTSRCCRRFVCKTCLSAAIISGIGTQWWFDLSNLAGNWLKCPVPCCGRSLPLYSSPEVAGALQKLGVHPTISHVERFEHAAKLRAALQNLDQLPSKDELRRAKALHDRLERHNRMRPLLDEDPSDAGGGGGEVPTPDCFAVDTADGRGTLTVPIFTHLLRGRTPRTCLVCDERYEEFDTGHTQAWMRAIRGFDGEWTWRVLRFPAASILPACHHDLDICRKCLCQYIATQIETQGHSVVDNIACPTPECTHKYTHPEVRHLASPEAFATYDRYTVLNSISSLPNFRWCLREGCTSGSLYDEPAPYSLSQVAEIDTNCIECSDCGFTMCYACQSPWHAGLTCAQYTSQREASFTETQTWLQEHTKPCPGESCGVQVQKGDGCFHMTCSRCRHEFCWECLADWQGIFVPDDDGGFLTTDGHREGCFFRGEGAPLPTQVMGQDIETGLRRLEQRAADAAPVV